MNIQSADILERLLNSEHQAIRALEAKQLITTLTSIKIRLQVKVTSSNLQTGLANLGVESQQETPSPPSEVTVIVSFSKAFQWQPSKKEKGESCITSHDGSEK